MLRQRFLRQFHFSKAERHGAAALLLLAIAAFAFPEVYRLFYRRNLVDSALSVIHLPVPETVAPPQQAVALFAFDPNTAPAEILVQLGLSGKVAGSIIKYREHGGRFRQADDLQKIYTLSQADFERLRPYIRIGGAPGAVSLAAAPGPAPEAFIFDPNTASENDLLRLGLPRALATRLLHYREKGGTFSTNADFRKLYGLSDQDFNRLEPYIVIAKPSAAKSAAVPAQGKSYAQAPLEIDINQATADDWQRLPGIGAARAQRLLQFREKLGGFASVEQVAETYGLPDSVFQRIAPQLRFNTPVFRKINLNTATAEELAAHPYFTAKQARLIVAFRAQHGPFGSVEALSRINALTDATWFRQVKPYLVAGPDGGANTAPPTLAN